MNRKSIGCPRFGFSDLGKPLAKLHSGQWIKRNRRGDSNAPPGLWLLLVAFPRIPLRSILGYYRWPLRGQIVRIKGQMCESGARSCESGARSCEVLRLVPLETDSAHYIIIATNMALCNMLHPWRDFPVSASFVLGVR